MKVPFFVRNFIIGIFFISVFLSGCVHQSGYVSSDYNRGLARQITKEEQRRKDLETARQQLQDEVERLQQEIVGLNTRITKLEDEATELRRKTEKTLNDISRIRAKEAEIEKLGGEVKKKKEMVALKEHELKESYRKDIS